MKTRVRNLADPLFEPTDDDLRELAHSAFKDVAAENERHLARFRAEIEERRKIVLEQVRRQLKEMAERK